MSFLIEQARMFLMIGSTVLCRFADIAFHDYHPVDRYLDVIPISYNFFIIPFTRRFKRTMMFRLSRDKNPEAAAEFVKFMTIGEGNDFWHEDVKSLSARTAVLEEEAESPEFQEFPDSIQLLAADESVNTSVIRPLMVGYSEYQDVFTACWEDIRNGGDPVETIDTYTAELNSLLAKYAE